MSTIRDTKGKMIGSTSTMGNKTLVRDWKSNKVVSSYNKSTNTTTDFKTNTQVKGDQSLRFLR
jgi:hypothetical protein